jgi:hypothetical protein
VGAGWRIEKFTPMVLYGKFNSAPSAIYPAGKEETFSASLRYDVVANVALKFELSRRMVSNAEYIVDPNYTSRERINVYSLGADFVIY